MGAILRRYARFRRAAQILFVLGGALAGSVCGTWAKLIGPPDDTLLYTVAIGGAVVAFLATVFFQFVDEGAAEVAARALEVIEDARAKDDELAQAAAGFNWIARLYATSRALREYLAGVVADGPPATVEAHVAHVVDLVLAEKQVLFAMGDEAWNFAVYLYDPAEQLLKCALCRRPLRQDEEAPHRAWQPGDGHVGIAWQRNEELVAPDLTDPAIEPYFRAKQGYRPDDGERYRSIASIPIGMPNAQPLGVLVATSDQIGRFRPNSPGNDAVEPLRLLALTLAMMLHASDVRGKEQTP